MRLNWKVASSVVFFLSLAPIPACAFSGHDALALDAAGISQLETRAEHAEPREQCFLYTELVEAYTDLAGQQMAAGQMEQASATLRRVERFVEKIHIGLARDSKRLKNAEIMMHNATYRLGEYMHHVSGDDQVVVKSTLKKLDKVNDELLAQVFSR